MSRSDSRCFLPVCRLGGDECPQRRECCVDRIGAISFPCVGGGPLATILVGRSPWGAESRRHGPDVEPSSPHSPAQLPLPVHLDVKGRWRRGGQAEGRGVGRVVALVRAWPLAPVLVVIFGEEGDVAVQEAACGRCRAQHGECHRRGVNTQAGTALSLMDLTQTSLVTLANGSFLARINLGWWWPQMCTL